MEYTAVKDNGGMPMHVLNSLPPHNLFGLEEQDYKTARIAVLPVPYDATSTYAPGSRFGPDAMIEASRNLELYDHEARSDPSRLGVFTLEQLAPDLSGPERMVRRVSREVSIILQDRKVPLLLGGEHTVAVGAIDALSNTRREFTILHFDAHSDSRDELFGSRYCHACAMARMAELHGDYYSIGVRSIDKDSAMRRNSRIIYMGDVRSMGIKALAGLLAMKSAKNIYVTFDFDCLDPSEMPSTGTPEPDGFRFSEIMGLFSLLLPKKNLIGMDFTELAPIPGMRAPDFLAAKLIYGVLARAYTGRSAAKP